MGRRTAGDQPPGEGRRGTAPPADAPGRVRAALETFIASRAGCSVQVVAFSRWPGGTMRHAWAADVEISSGALAGRHPLIYLEDRGGAPLPGRLDREAEFQVLSVMHGAGIRVPKPYWRLRGGEAGLGAGLVLERVEGETVARRILRDPAFEAVRGRLPAEVGGELARIHAVPTDGLGCLSLPAAGGGPAEGQLAGLDRTLGEIGEPHPALELALRWLGRRPPRSERIVAVHGDYRLGNFIVDPRQGLRAVLDWELSHLGDPGEDVAWVVMRFWRFAEGAGPGARQRVLDAYAAAAGASLPPDWVHYWEVFANLRWAVVTLGQARRHLDGHEPSIELASIGRHCAEVEWELLRLLRDR